VYKALRSIFFTEALISTIFAREKYASTWPLINKTMELTSDQYKTSLYNRAIGLALFTIIYNIIEGLISVYFGLKDETLALFGFGADSFIETISGIGILIMIIRLKRFGETNKGRFEKLALQITGWCFYVLALVLLVNGIYNLIKGVKPETTLPGVIITGISIVVMIWLVIAKKQVGRKLDSPPIIADANCSLVCVYMSVVVLLSSLLFEIFHIGWIDLLGTAGIIYFSVKEGAESFEKARSNGYGCSCEHCEEVPKVR
jgi:divalent metal cation (Fe/Co/Zn/Cd) transporter